MVSAGRPDGSENPDGRLDGGGDPWLVGFSGLIGVARVALGGTPADHMGSGGGLNQHKKHKTVFAGGYLP